MQLAPYRKREMTRFEDAMHDMFDRVLGAWETPFAEPAWVPALDIAEREDEIVIKAELPGMKAEDIDISVQGNTLTLSGEKSTESEKKEENYYHVERRYGTFRRTLTLPTQVDPDKIEAHHAHGVLTITLPKSEKERARRIPVK